MLGADHQGLEQGVGGNSNSWLTGWQGAGCLEGPLTAEVPSTNFPPVAVLPTPNSKDHSGLGLPRPGTIPQRPAPALERDRQGGVEAKQGTERAERMLWAERGLCA